MLRRLVLLPALAALIVPLTSRSARAQEPDTVAPAHVAFVEGAATLEREGRAENAPLNMPLLSGDRLRTSEGRVEILFSDGSTLYLDARTTIDFQSDELLRLIDGRVRVNIPGPARSMSYRIDSPAGSVRIAQPGDYRVSMLRGDRDTQVELAVVRGAGEVFTDQGSTPVRAGERAYASAGLAPSYPYTYNSATWDDFDRWSETRRAVRLGVSAQYLPAEVRTYAPMLDEYGDWRYNQPYGYVWYPRVAVGWRPYYYGRWMSYPRYGWTWVGLDRFGWPTHHYGRWGFSAGAWFWIPGARWSPAWVSWAYAPGYVSWCPLGFDNRAVFQINVNIGNRYYSPWNAWTVVAAPHFGYGYVHQRVIYVDRVFDRRSRPVFQPRASAPAFRDVAVPRNSAPIRWAGSRSLPSSGAAAASANSPEPWRRQPGGRTTASPGRATGSAGSSNASRDSVTREGVRADHAVERGSSVGLPASTRPPRDVPATRRADVAPGVMAPRAVPRGPASDAAVSPRLGSATPGGAVRRTAPNGMVRPIEPRGSSDVARERIGRDVRQPTYSPGPLPVMREPRRVERSEAPAAMTRQPNRPSPQYAPREYAPREYGRPDMAVPRQAPAPRAYEPRGYEPRAAEPRREAAPPPRPPQRSAPSERAVPREGARSAPGQPAPSSRRGRGGV